MLRKRIILPPKDEKGKKVYKNYITATYEGDNIKFMDDRFDISQVETVVYGEEELGAISSHNFGAVGTYTVKIVMKPLAKSCMYMFAACKELRSFDLSRFDMSNVTSVQYMFRDTHYITNVILENLNWANVTSAYGLFDSSVNLERITFKNVYSPQLNSIGFAFNWTSMRSCDLSGLNLENVTDMSGLFKDCWSLKEFRINSPVDKLTNVNEMFTRVWTRGNLYYNKKYGYGIISPPSRWTLHAV